ncbi:hypothetical protein ACFQ10_46430 [Streptomyces indonesiensis]
MELAALLHGWLGIEIHDYELMDAATIADVVRLLEERLPHAGVEAAEGRP